MALLGVLGLVAVLQIPPLRPLLAGSDPADEISGDETPIEAELAALELQIAALGSDRWEDREAATAAILEIGAVAVPSLKVLRDSSDPEIRSRVDWILSVLIPPFHQIEIVRVAGEKTIRPVEWGRAAFPAKEFGETETIQVDGLGRRLRIRVEGESSPYEVEIEISTERGTIELSGRVPLDTISRLEREEVFTIEDSLGVTKITRESAAWLVRLMRTEGPPPPSSFETAAQIERWIERGIDEAVARDDLDSLREGVRVAASTGRLDPIPPIDAVPFEVRTETALARFVAGDSRAKEALAEALSADNDGMLNLDVALADEIARVLAAAGSPVALEALLARFSESPLWRQHRTAGVLRTLLASPDALATHGTQVLDTILDRTGIDGIHFEDGLIVALLQDLERLLPPENFSERFIRELDIVLGEATGVGANRLRAMLRVLHTTLRRHPVPTDQWLEPVIGLLGSSFSEDAFALLLDRRVSGDLDDDQWRAVWMGLAERLGVADAGLLYRTRNCLVRILALPDLATADRRQLWIEQLRCFPLEGQNLRSTVDGELRKKFGELGVKPPPHNDTEGWAERAEVWRKKLTELPDEEFTLEAPEEAKPLRLTVADLRLLPSGGGVELIDCTSRLVIPGRAPIEIGPDLDDRTLRLERYGTHRTGMYRLHPGAVLNVDRPVSRRLRRYWRNSGYVVSESRIGLVTSTNSGAITFDSLLFLEEIESEENATEESGDVLQVDAKFVPAEGDSPETAYEKLCARIVAKLPHSEPRFRAETLVLIGKFQIEAARAPLAELFEARPDVELARSLLGLGDPRGQDLLLDSVRSGDRQSIEVLVSLLGAGVGAAVDKAMDWIENASPRGGSPYALIRALDAAFSDVRLVDHLDEERFFEVLVGALDARSMQNVVVPILRKRTGLDFGYYDAFQILDTEERATAQEECYESWRRWWSDRAAASKSE